MVSRHFCTCFRCCSGTSKQQEKPFAVGWLLSTKQWTLLHNTPSSSWELAPSPNSPRDFAWECLSCHSLITALCLRPQGDTGFYSHFLMAIPFPIKEPAATLAFLFLFPRLWTHFMPDKAPTLTRPEPPNKIFKTFFLPETSQRSEILFSLHIFNQ